MCVANRYSEQQRFEYHQQAMILQQLVECYCNTAMHVMPNTFKLCTDCALSFLPTLNAFHFHGGGVVVQSVSMSSPQAQQIRYHCLASLAHMIHSEWKFVFNIQCSRAYSEKIGWLFLTADHRYE